jgi:hypothetical protein
VAADTLIETSATCVAGPIPHPSSLLKRFKGEVAGLFRLMRGFCVVPVPPPPKIGTG